MSSHSITSSMEPQNGSSYQSENSYPPSYNQYPSATTMAQPRYPGGQRPTYNSASHPLDNGHGSRFQDSAVSEPQTYVQPTNGYDHFSNNQDYYLRSEPRYYAADTPTYENVLNVEDDQNEASAPAPAHNQRPDQVRRNPRGQTSAPGHSTSQYATNGHTRQYSETTQNWVGQQSSDEMLRLGLPSDSQQRAREYEQARREYEQAASSYPQYDSSTGRGH